MTSAKLVNVIVLVGDAHRDRIDRLVKLMIEKGFVLGKGGTLKEIGVVKGSVPPHQLALLRSIDGVSSVQEERTDYRSQAG